MPNMDSKPKALSNRLQVRTSKALPTAPATWHDEDPITWAHLRHAVHPSSHSPHPTLGMGRPQHFRNFFVIRNSTPSPPPMRRLAPAAHCTCTIPSVTPSHTHTLSLQAYT